MDDGRSMEYESGDMAGLLGRWLAYFLVFVLSAVFAYSGKKKGERGSEDFRGIYSGDSGDILPAIYCKCNCQLLHWKDGLLACVMAASHDFGHCVCVHKVMHFLEERGISDGFHRAFSRHNCIYRNPGLRGRQLPCAG